MDIQQLLKEPLAELLTSNPFLGALGTERPRVGSLIDGSTLDYVPCAFQECTERGTSACSKCRLVKYCSKECQKNHWKTHKVDCNGQYASSSWKPQWVTESRAPSFVKWTSGSTTFGNDEDLWGDTPATDILNIPLNEGKSGVKQDFMLCFTSSHNIRDLVKTVNGLPAEYQGLCFIILNDESPNITIRNLIILAILFDAELPAAEAGELAFHIMYSAMITARQALHLYRWALGFFEQGWDKSAYPDFRVSIEGSYFQSLLPREIFKLAAEMLSSTYSTTAARTSMTEVMLAPSRLDYRERWWACLRPGHRLGEMRFRSDGIALPFGAHREHFSQPNRFMFSPKGEWLSGDVCSPIQGWDLKNVTESGVRKSATPEDLFGCLFFHVKNCFVEFARRIRTMRIQIFQHSLPVPMLRKFVIDNPEQSLPSSQLDRIATANIMDNLSLSALISDWGPLLNKSNPKSALLAHSNGWHSRQPGSGPETSGVQAVMQMSLKATKYFNFSPSEMTPDVFSYRNIIMAVHLGAFHDTDPSFEAYLKKLRVDERAEERGLRRRRRNTIRPQVVGSSLANPRQRPPDLSRDDFYYIEARHCTWLARFLEFEPNI